MTQPRLRLPGTTYLVTHTVHDRRFLLTPSPQVNRIALYCAARAARVTGVEVHWLVVLSNHIHVGVTDFDTDLSRFMHAMDRAIARCLIAYYRQTHPHRHLDAVWSRRSFSEVALLTPEAVIDAMVYSLTNPVKDGLVRDYRKWPGVCSRPADWVRSPRQAERPDYFFDQTDDDWASAALALTVPPMLRDRPVEQVVDDIEAHLRDRQQALREAHAREGRSFRGVKAVRRAEPFESPTSVRPKGGRNPTVAAGGNREMLREGIRLVRHFRERYRAAWLEYKAGGRDIVFPAGTLLMRTVHAVRCDEVHAPWCVAALTPG